MGCRSERVRLASQTVLRAAADRLQRDTGRGAKDGGLSEVERMNRVHRRSGVSIGDNVEFKSRVCTYVCVVVRLATSVCTCVHRSSRFKDRRVVVRPVRLNAGPRGAPSSDSNRQREKVDSKRSRPIETWLVKLTTRKR